MNVKQYTSLIKDFFNRHAQINTVASGNAFDFNAKSDIVYPVAHVEFLDQSNRDEIKSFQFIITIADLFDPNLKGGQEDIYSDCNQIADDALDYFSNQIQPIYTVRETATIRNFNNGHTDKVCGSTFALIFEESREANDCLIPFKNL